MIYLQKKRKTYTTHRRVIFPPFPMDKKPESPITPEPQPDRSHERMESERDRLRREDQEKQRERERLAYTHRQERIRIQIECRNKLASLRKLIES